MSLKSINLLGFKSFPDDTKISLHNGITAIVGPNGCGKSNFAEAIRFVLGESKQSNLRIDNLDGAIFSGTTGSGARGRSQSKYCQVEVVLDNTSRYLSLNTDEIILTRKYTRSGTSEYYINQQKVKRQDLYDLLRDTGIGREGYSIIPQGTIDDIVKSGPTRRREILEEAAGISSFKARKKESLDKLNKTVDNIEKFTEVLNELEKHLTPLRKEAENARRYNELIAEQKSLEVNQFLYQADNTEEFKRKYKEALEQITIDLNNVGLAINTAKESIFKAENRREQIKIRKDELLDERTKLYILESDRSGKVKLQQAKIENAETLKKKAEKDLQESNAIIERILKEIEDDKEQLNIHKNRLNELQAELSVNMNELNNVNELLGKASTSLNDERERSIKALQLAGDIKANKSKYETEKKLIEDDIDRLKSDLVKHISNLKEKEEEIVDVEKKIKQITNSQSNNEALVKSIEDEYQDKKKELEDFAENNIKKKELFSAAKSRLETLIAVRENYDGFQAGVQNLLKAAKFDTQLADKMEGLVLDHITVDQKYEKAIQTALAAAIQNVITRNVDDAKYVIKFIRDNRLGRIRCLPLDTIKHQRLHRNFESTLNMKGVCGLAVDLVKFEKRYLPVYEHLLGGIVICEDIDVATNVADRFDRSFKIVTLSGETIETSGAMSGGASRHENNFLSINREIDELQSQLTKLQNEISNSDQNKKELQNAIAIMDEELLSSKNLLNENSVKLGQYEIKHEELLKVIGDLKELKENLEKSIALKQERHAILLEGLSAAEADESSLNSSTKDLGSSVTEQEKEQANLLNKKEELNNKITSTNLDIKTSENIVNNNSVRIEKNENELESRRKTVDDSNVIIAEQDVILQEAREALADMEISDEAKQKVNEISVTLNELQEEDNQLIKLLKDNREDSERLTGLTMTLNEERVRNESEIAKIDEQLLRMASYIIETYGLDNESAKEFFDENFEFRGSQTKVNDIKKEIAKMGPINHKAIADEQVQLERYNDLQSSINDLKFGESELREIIQDLNTTIYSKFTDQFNKINENFKEIFKQLFNGGEAELKLIPAEEGEDELNYTVDILAKPPGKTLTSITGLSGGEKSMTALAILFAIIKLKASPFCILDEIDAALDDSNIYLFAQYLKKFSQNIQFIVITHRQETMKAADRLNGIVMEERGVSKVLKVTINEAADFIQEG